MVAPVDPPYIVCDDDVHTETAGRDRDNGGGRERGLIDGFKEFSLFDVITS